MNQRIYLFLALIWFLATLAVSTEPLHAGDLVVDAKLEKISLMDHFSVIETVTDHPDPEEVMQLENDKWMTPGNVDQNQGFSDSVFWLKINLKNPDQQPLERLLVSKSSFLENVYLYQIDANGNLTSRQAGVLARDELNGFNNRTPVFPIVLPPHSDTSFLLKIKSATSIQLTFTLEKLSFFYQQRSFENIFIGTFYGILFGIACYNLFLFFFIRDNTYFYYSLYQFCILLFGAGGDGSMMFFSAFVINSGVFRHTIIALGYMAGAQFVREFLNTPKHFPRTDKIIFSLILLLIPQLFLPFVPLAYTSWFYRYSTGLGFFLTLVAIFVGILAFIKKIPMARYFLIGWTGLLVGANLFILSTLGIFEDNIITMKGFQFGAVLEAIFLSLALADRVRQTDREIETSQEKVMSAQQKALENLNRADELKDQIMASTSHELRTPLHGIIGLAENIQNDSRITLSSAAKDNLDLVLSSGKRLSHLINDMLDSSALRQGKIRLQKEPVSLKNNVDSVIRLSEPLISGKNYQLTNEVDRTFPALDADPARLQQILLNLIGNSIKYSESGEIRVSSHLDQGKAIISVSDSGPGISEKLKEKIFKAYERVEQSQHKLQEGIGLGLNICQQLVEAHGGKIWLAPTDVGANFEFSLLLSKESIVEVETINDPFIEIENQSLSLKNFNPELPQVVEEGDKKNGQILLVDDDPVNLHVLVGYLGQQNYNITVCNNGQEALSIIQEDLGIDLILLDVMLPRMDGIEVCELLRDQFSKTELPVLLLTALDSREDIMQGFQAGANDYLCKPFHKKELLSRFSLFEDAEGTLNAEDVWRMDENKWQKPLSYNQNLGYNSSVFWLKLKLKNLESKAQKRLLFAKSSYLETTDLYLMNLDGGLKVHHSGSLIPMSQRHFPHRTPTFVISLAAESETDILIKINSTTSVQFNFTLENIPSFHQTKSSENIFLGVFYGVLFGIASYNLFLFLFIRDITYLYYSIYQICILLFGTAGDGNILYLVPDSAWSTAVFRNTVIAVGYIAGALFVRKFLDTPKNFPFIDNIMKTLMVLFIPQLMIPFVPITWTTSFYQYGTILGFILISLALVLGVLALIKKVRMARYFLLGWFMLLIGANFFILSTYGIFQDYLISMRGFQIGAMLESILLSLALADRVRQSQRDRQSSQMKVVEAQQQALENLHKTDELKKQILASTSHELRTPLHGIIGLVEAVQEESQNNLPHWARENLQLILNNGHRLNHLINDLLDSSALRQGQIVLQKEVVSLNFSVAAVLRLATSLTLGKEVKLINEVSSSLPPVEVDPSRFQQILLNLLNNAIKYSGEGNIVVTAVSLGEQVIVSVIDKGPGIPDEQSEHIFNAFEKGTVQSASFQEGIGLGLSICQQLVKAHGGKIWLEPTSVGATFCFSLQALPNYKILTDQPQQQSQITNHPPEVAGTAFPKQNKQETSNKLIDGNILIVDDDQVNLHVLMGYLGQENFWITACNNAEDALNMIDKDESFDLVLLDVMMPDMDGFEICEIIREKHSESELPILLLTALDSREDITHGYEAGANDYLCKPFQKNVLMSRLLAHLHLSERWIKRQGKTRVSKNEVLIDLLQSSLNYWQSDLNKTMLELAQESGWGVYMEKHSGTWRSRGFEKYLNLQTIPKNPRWRKVLQTAQYVMEQLPMGSTSHNELKSKLNRLMEVWKS